MNPEPSHPSHRRESLDRVELPMFPLGSVLLPSMLLPLHIFEERYRRLIDDVLAGDGTFGVTLIERGSEVGGDDVRAPVGCLAQVLDAEQQPDGRWFIVATGTERIRVDDWLPDDPYPRAVVSSLPDPSTDLADWDGLVVAFRDLISLVERVTGRRDLAPGVPISDDPALATYEMAIASPIGPLDRYRVLCGADAEARRLVLLDAFEHATVLVNDATSN
jgi:Lon protease-like protein